MTEAKIITAENGERYAAIPLEEFQEFRTVLDQLHEEIQMLKAEQTAGRIDRGEEILIPAEVAARVIVDGVRPLKAFREWRGLSQEELSERAATSKSYVSQIETGYRQPGRKTLRKLARVLEVPMDTLMD